MTLTLPSDATLTHLLQTGKWATLPVDTKRDLRDSLARLVFEQQRSSWTPYPWQRPHAHPPGHDQVCDETCHDRPVAALTSGHAWLLLGGRGTGKTDGAARYVSDHVLHGPPCDPRLPGGHRIAIVAPTLGDAVESCVNGPSGLSAHARGVRAWSSLGGTYVKFPNGALGKVFGAHTPDDVERLRAGGNRCLVWWEELAAWRYIAEAMEHSRLGLRLGSAPHVVASTTPKPRPEITRLVRDPRVLLTRGRTADAHHLDEGVRADYLQRYAGTRSGRQELDGELLRDVEGALWTLTQIEAGRVLDVDPLDVAADMARLVVAIDPAASNTEDSDETGIVVVGASDTRSCPVCGEIDDGPHGFVLADRSARMSPERWASTAIDAYDEYEADEIVGEVNNGGDMIGSVLRSARRNVPYREVRATRGKRVRAEPVSLLAARRRWHHVGAFPQLEDQMTTWTPDDKISPDRMDAMVWGAHATLLSKSGGGFASVV